MTNINWTTPRFVDLPDLRMAVFEAGSPSPTHPTIILCHGFPEIAYSWRHIIAPLADLGYQIAAYPLTLLSASMLAMKSTLELMNQLIRKKFMIFYRWTNFF